uniref:DUF4218 domain-containing protein n=1 Tax=Amphimedon queenslandica TaxID=400682 RepID=A0A1X7VGD3_AMPQE
MLLIARIFPFIIGDKVSEDDMHYKCFLMLLKILNIVMSPYIIHEVPPYLRVLIEEHHSLFVELYPNESFIPKLHYLIHYPKQIEEQRPIVRAWIMRYKGKLKYFKGVSGSGNFKNITYTLAKRHQKWLAYHLQTRSMFTPECTRGPILSTVSLSEDSDDIQSLIKQNIDVPDSDISSCTVVTLKWIMIMVSSTQIKIVTLLPMYQ